MADRDHILEYCASRLDAGSYQDVAINGLQVEGTSTVNRIAIAVSASDYTISAAAGWEADALLVHHGLLWGSQLQPLTGLLGNRLRKLFQHNINLIGYHLPLDGHEEIGNNTLLAQAFGLQIDRRFGDVAGMPLGVICRDPDPSGLLELLARIEQTLDRLPVTVGPTEPPARIERIAILSGSGYSTLSEAAALGCQVLITGDLREPTMAEAREHGIVGIAAGHEATERTGVQALASELEQRFDVETRFFVDPNPI
ncbi:Nif3-like dinuclear metal center hexameric protein [soil metagenome]